MTSAFLPEDESSDSSNHLQGEAAEHSIPASRNVTPSVNLDANPVFQQVLPIEMQQAPSPYRGEPLQAPSIVPEAQEQANLSFSPNKSASVTDTWNVMQRFWLLVLGAAVIALVVVSGLRSQNAPLRRPIPPTRIPQTNVW